MEKKDITLKKSPIQRKLVKATPLFASPNRFEVLSKICNSEGESLNAQISECTLAAVSVPMPVITPITPMMSILELCYR